MADERTDTELLVSDCAALVERLTRRAVDQGWIPDPDTSKD